MVKFDAEGSIKFLLGMRSGDAWRLLSRIDKRGGMAVRNGGVQIAVAICEPTRVGHNQRRRLVLKPDAYIAFYQLEYFLEHLPPFEHFYFCELKVSNIR